MKTHVELKRLQIYAMQKSSVYYDTVDMLLQKKYITK